MNVWKGMLVGAIICTVAVLMLAKDKDNKVVEAVEGK
jgi:gas vesicle protein